MKVTQQRLKEVLNYNPETGVFVWIKPTANSVRVGDLAKSKNATGYICIHLDNVNYLAHRLAWLYMTGEFPKGFIDHINCERSDNRFCNLRVATHSQNMQNQHLRKTNKSGYKGVSWCKTTNKWQAQCTVGGKKYQLGRHEKIEDAVSAVREFREMAHGDFANHGVKDAS